MARSRRSNVYDVAEVHARGARADDRAGAIERRSRIAPREREEFRGLWQNLRLDNLTTELADQLHMVSRINVLKFAALGRLYQGVGVMTVLLTLLLLTAALALPSTGPAARAKWEQQQLNRTA